MMNLSNASPPQSTSHQAGFSLFEVLLSMFIAAVAVAGVMALHARNLSQVTDNVHLMRAQMVLNNAAARINVDANLNQSMADDAVNQQMTGVTVSSANLIITGQFGRLLMIQWSNHDSSTSVWRCPLLGVPAVADRSCLELWVLP
jgi:prepilin-type N-terminal cleavage/methylation domain-containing protein